MIFKQHASSSKGNLYEVQEGDARILIEAGISIRGIHKASGFNLHNFSGCLVSHRHADHAKSVKPLVDFGVPMYCSKDTAEHCSLGDGDYIPLEPFDIKKVAPFAVMPFDVTHYDPDGQECPTLGFSIRSESGDLLTFITDAVYSQYTFPRTTIMAIEANHSREMIDDSSSVDRRAAASHMSIETLMEALSKNDLSECREIHLLHVSETRGDAEEFRARVEDATGIPTYICATK